MAITFAPLGTPVEVDSTAEFQAHAAETHEGLFPGDGLTSYTAAALASLANSVGYNDPAVIKSALERLSATAADIAARVQV